MSDYGASPQPRTSRHGSGDDDDSGVSRSRHRSRDGDDEERGRHRGRDHDRRHRDRGRDETERRERKRTRYDRDDDGYDRRSDRRERDDDGYDRRSDRRERDDDGYDRRSDRRGRDDRHRSRSPEERSERRRERSKSQRISGFDMAPPGVDLSGISQAGLPPPPALPALATRNARRVYVGGLPPTANELGVGAFFSHVMAAIGGNTAGPGDAVINVYINHDKKFAFVEMRSVEEASNAMALNGIFFEGAPVKVNRPSDYNHVLAASLGPTEPSQNLNLAAVGLTGSAGALEGPDRIFIGGLPYTVTEADIRKLLEEPFGPLRGLDLVKDKETGNSKGYAFCAFQDPKFTDAACAALNGYQISHNRTVRTLKVNRASQGASSPKELESVLSSAHQHIAIQKLLMTMPIGTSKVVCLTGALNPDDLKEDEEYEDIVEDMENECRKFGALVKAVIPRPSFSGDVSGGVGKVFLEYGDVQSAAIARQALHGRTFDGNQVVAVFYPDDKFSQGDYMG